MEVKPFIVIMSQDMFHCYITLCYKVTSICNTTLFPFCDQEKLSYMKKSLGFMASLTSEELGLDQEEMQVTIDIEVRDTPPVKPIRLKPKAKPR